MESLVKPQAADRSAIVPIDNKLHHHKYLCFILRGCQDYPDPDEYADYDDDDDDDNDNAQDLYGSYGSGDEQKYNSQACHSVVWECLNGEEKGFEVEHLLKKGSGIIEDPKQHQAWSDFMKECGFPNHWSPYEGNEWIGSYTQKHPEYNSSTHYWVGLTALRYPFYSYANGFVSIPHIAMDIYRSLPELDAYQSLLMAHYPFIGEYWDSGHGMVHSHRIIHLITRDEMLKRTAGKRAASCNENCTRYKDASRAKYLELLAKISSAIKAGKYREAYENLQEEGLIN